jgi:hypothetical protein
MQRAVLAHPLAAPTLGSSVPAVLESMYEQTGFHSVVQGLVSSRGLFVVWGHELLCHGSRKCR